MRLTAVSLALQELRFGRKFQMGNGGVAGELRVATPSADVPGGGYGPAQTVTLTDSTPGASIYYTTDESDPDNTDTLYTVPISVTVSLTLKAIGIDGVLPDSRIMTEVYVINGTVATPVITLAGNTFNNDTSTTATCATSGASMFYTRTEPRRRRVIRRTLVR